MGGEGGEGEGREEGGGGLVINILSEGGERGGRGRVQCG